MDSSTLIAHLKRIHRTLDSETRNLATLLKNSKLNQAYAFELPRTLKNQEEKIYSHIPVTRHKGKDACSLANQFYQNFYLESPFYSSKSIGRLPGVICIQSSNPQKITCQLDLINELKQEFHYITKSFSNAYHRHQVLHDKHNFPGLILTYLTRNISYYEGSVDTASFSWVHKSNHSKISRDEAIEKLLSSQSKLPKGQLFNEVSWFDRVNHEIVMLQSLPPTIELRLYRPLKLKVITNLLLTKEYDTQLLKERKLQKEGNLPLILINPGPCVIHSLKDYVSTKKIKRGRVKSEPKLISSLLNIYTPTN